MPFHDSLVCLHIIEVLPAKLPLIDYGFQVPVPEAVRVLHAREEGADKQGRKVSHVEDEESEVQAVMKFLRWSVDSEVEAPFEEVTV